MDVHSIFKSILWINVVIIGFMSSIKMINQIIQTNIDNKMYVLKHGNKSYGPYRLLYNFKFISSTFCFIFSINCMIIMLRV